MIINPRIRMAGVTLVELMVVIVVAAILLGIGIPSFKNITTSYRVSGEINSLLGDLQFARAEAIKEGQSVTICALPSGAGSSPTQAPTQCVTSVGAGWQNGWIVYPVVSSAPTAASSAASVLRYQPAFSGNTPDTLVDRTNGIVSVTFNREGIASGLGASDTFLSLHNSTANAYYTRCLQITMVGAAQVTQHSRNASCT